MTWNGAPPRAAGGDGAMPVPPHSAPGELLTSVVTVARSVFGAAASSIMLLDEPAGELVFAAVAGQGEDSLVGRRFPADRGIAGWVAATGEAMIVDQVSANAVFARDVAESTGYVPESIMAAQIAHEGNCRPPYHPKRSQGSVQIVERLQEILRCAQHQKGASMTKGPHIDV